MASIMTTLGPRRADELGMLLPHEHVFVDLRTWDQPGYAEADPAAVIALMGPEIERARAAGVTAIVECSTVGVGRRADIDGAVSAATGFPLVVPTGHLPRAVGPRLGPRRRRGRAIRVDARRAQRRDRRHRGPGGLDQAQRRRRRAHRHARRRSCERPRGPRRRPTASSGAIRSGAASFAISSTSSRRPGCPPDRFIWIHTQAEPDLDLHLEIARRGGWIEYDAIGSDDFDDAFFVARIQRCPRRRPRRSRAVEPGSGLVRSGAARWRDAEAVHLPERAVPAPLRSAGLDEAEITRLTERNPFDAFAR